MLKQHLVLVLFAFSFVFPAVCMDVNPRPVELMRLVHGVQESEDYSTITTQDGQECKVLDRLLKVSKTLSNLMEDSDTVHDAIPLPYISSEIWHIIQPLLPHVFAMVHAGGNDASQEEKDIIAALQELGSQDLLEFIKAVNYLNIPMLLDKAMDVADVEKISLEQLFSLPKDICNAIIYRQAVHMLGLRPLKHHTSCIGFPELIRSICVTHDNTIVIGDFNGSMTIWNPLIRQTYTWAAHTKSVNAVCVTHDNKIVSASDDNTVRIWDMQGNQLAVCHGQTGWFHSVCVTNDNQIVSGSHDCTIRVWDTAGNPLGVHSIHSDPIYELCITVDNTLVTRSYDALVRVWDMNGKLLATCKGHTEKTSSLCVTQDNKIVSGSHDCTVRVWNMAGKQLAVCKGHTKPIYWVGITHDNKIVSASYDGTVRVWDMAGDQFTLSRGPIDLSHVAYITPDNKIVSGCFGKKVYISHMPGPNPMVSLDREKAQKVWEYLQKLSRKFESISSYQGVDCWKHIASLLDPKVVKSPSASGCTIL